MIHAALLLAAVAAVQPGAEQQTRAALHRIRTTEPKIHAVIALDPTALAQARALDRRPGARGPLFGMPVLIKDNIETAGPLATTAGSLALAANVTGHDAPLVAGLRAAGAVIVGKANLSEWANMRSSASLSGWSGLGGQTRNPHALDRSPCGSSAGSAAAVAAGEVPAAIGTETDGSITCPAAVTGIVGLKPTLGLVSRTRVVPISHSQDTPGPMARDVRTVARLLTAIAGSDPADPATAPANGHRADYASGLKPDALAGARIGVVRLQPGWPAPVEMVFERALATLRAQGAILVDIPYRKDERIGQAEDIVLKTEFKADLDAYLAGTPSGVTARSLAALIAFDRSSPRELALFGQDVFEAAQRTSGLADPAYRQALATARRLAGAEGIDRLLAVNRVSALVAPTVAPAWPIDVVNGDQIAAYGIGGLAAVAGYPHLTVPMGEVRGLPVGLSFIGAAWSEATLLGYGHAYEQASHALVKPRFSPSIEETSMVAPLLEPAR